MVSRDASAYYVILYGAFSLIVKAICDWSLKKTKKLRLL